MAALVLLMAMLYASADGGLAATNCGFLTIEQCRATVSDRERHRWILRAQSILQSCKICQRRPQTRRGTRLCDALRSLSVVCRIFGRRKVEPGHLSKRVSGRASVIAGARVFDRYLGLTRALERLALCRRCPSTPSMQRS